MHMPDFPTEPVQFMFNNFTGDSAVGNYIGDFPPQLFAHLINHRLMPLQPELPGNRKARWPTTDDGNFLSRRGSRPGRFRLQTGLAKQGNIRRFKISSHTCAMFHAEIGAEVTANSRRKWGVGKRQIHSFTN